MSHYEKAGMTDEWYTPKYIFDALNVTFDTDAASPIDRSFCHVPANRFIVFDSLNTDWLGFTWLNPPFGGRNGLIPWLDKMNKHRNGIVLTPDRTSAPWWQKAANQSDALLLIHSKVKFIMPNGDIGTKPGTGTTLFAYGTQAVRALLNARDNKLGTLFTRIS